VGVLVSFGARPENPSLTRPRRSSAIRACQIGHWGTLPRGGPKSNADTKSIATSDWARPKNNIWAKRSRRRTLGFRKTFLYQRISGGLNLEVQHVELEPGEGSVEGQVTRRPAAIEATVLPPIQR